MTEEPMSGEVRKSHGTDISLGPDVSWAGEVERTAEPFADNLHEAIFQHEDMAMMALLPKPAISIVPRESWRARLVRSLHIARYRIQDAWKVLFKGAELRDEEDYW